MDLYPHLRMNILYIIQKHIVLLHDGDESKLFDSSSTFELYKICASNL